jgi:antiviral helicase SKI2
MVFICSNEFSKEDEMKYIDWFNIFHYELAKNKKNEEEKTKCHELSVFQKYAIKSIVSGCHSLSCVPTGSGKTMAALFAIIYFTQTTNKRIIYTSPIKSLSNQKYYEFTRLFPNLSVGLLTGDIKINPEAQILIMTAEILQNSLLKYQEKQNKHQETTKEQETTNPDDKNKTNSSLSFEMDYQNDLICVIHDEIHIINDFERGHVWETIILSLPKKIQMVMLSATLDKPEKFAKWIENKTELPVYLSVLKQRPVPLTHYSYITCCSKIFKQTKGNDSLQKEIRDNIDKLKVIQSHDGVFNEENYHSMKNMTNLFNTKQVYNNRQFVLNQLCCHMKINGMFPAVCFILSKKQIQKACQEINTNLLEDDSKIPYITKYECENLLRDKLPNYKEYLELPEYINMVSLMEKGIAIHHSGVIPVLREIVELLFERGFIKLLFATETFSIGLNMPIKTAIFTSIYKFDGNENRVLYPHEYIQAAGRAGRRGIDVVGNVIHLHNLFNCNIEEYRNMLKGQPQKLISKFKFSYNLILNKISSFSSIQSIINIYNDSFMNEEIELKSDLLKTMIGDNYNDNIKLLYPIDEIEKYIQLSLEIKNCSIKKKKTIEKQLNEYKNNYKFIDKEKDILLNIKNKKEEQNLLILELNNNNNYIRHNIQIIINKLSEENYITINNDNSNTNNVLLLKNGIISKNLYEINCLVFSKLFNYLFSFTSIELVNIFSCMTSIQITNDENKEYNYKGTNNNVNLFLENIEKEYKLWLEFETIHCINTGLDYTIHYDLINYISEWCSCNNEEECKSFLFKIEKEKGIYLGDFIKAIMKINNIAKEFDEIAQDNEYYDFSLILREIPQLLIKYVITEQSLYL